MTTRHWIALAAAVLTFSGCASTQGPATVAESAAHHPQLRQFAQLVKAAGMDETLKTGGPYTVFAPSDAAFESVPEKTLSTLKADKEKLAALIRYHMLPGKLSSADIKDGATVTVEGGKLALAKAGSFVTVEDAVVTEPDLVAANGVVHVVDRVLMPPAAKK